MDNPNHQTQPNPTNPQSAVPAPVPATVQDLAATMGATAADKGQPSDPAAEQARRVNDGRLKKASEDLAAANAKIAELQAQVAKLSSGKPAFDAASVKKLAKNPDEIGDDFAETMGAGLNAVQQSIKQEVKGEFDALRAELKASQEAAAGARTTATMGQTLQAVEKVAPGLVSRIARGDLRDRWEAFLDTADPFSGLEMRGILKDAVRNGRADAAEEVYRRFVKEAGLSGQYDATMAPPRGAASSAARPPDTVDGKRVYESRAQLESEYLRVSQDRTLSETDRQAKKDEIKSALAEHRYLK